MKRKPCVAGFFYPGQKNNLEDMLQSMMDKDREKQEAICVVSPHAGYVYSGQVAGAVFSSVRLPNKLILLGPSHRAIQTHFAIMREGKWSTPLGDLKIATDLADRILQGSDLVSEDADAHMLEHSLEVQLPFIQFFNPSCEIVPISNTYFASFEELDELGKAVSAAVQQQGEAILIVASTDMSHQVTQETAEKKDFMAIEKILDLDASGLYEVVKKEQISMCGFQATTAALIAAKQLGAQKAELIQYQTSGDVTGDYNSVVGYAGIRIT